MTDTATKNFYLLKPLACVLFGGILLLGNYVGALAQTSYQDGQKWYQQRAAAADSFYTTSQNIDKAIRSFEESLKVKYRSKETVVRLLQSYYFKGMHTELDNGQKKQVFDRARQLGHRMSEEYPESVAIKYWYGRNLRQWDRLHNLWQTTIDRTDRKLRDIARNVITLDSTYQAGGGYRLLAKIHYETPGIWLIKGWPSDDEALRLIQKAVKVAPDFPENRLFYARMLIHFGRMAEAKTQLKHLQQLNPRSSHLVEDRYVKYRAQQLWQEHLTAKKE